MNKNEKFVLILVILFAVASIIATGVVVIHGKNLKDIVDIKNNYKIRVPKIFTDLETLW